MFASGKHLVDTSVATDSFVEPYCKFSSYFGISGVAQNGSVQFSYCHRRVITKDTFGGASRVAVHAEVNQELLEKINNFLKLENYTGCFMFEFGICDGITYLIELNPRLWGSFPIAMRHFKQLMNSGFSQSEISDKYYDKFIFLLSTGVISFLKSNPSDLVGKNIYIAPHLVNYLKV